MGSFKKTKMKLFFAVFVAAASAVEWPNVDITYTYPDVSQWSSTEEKQTTCAEAEAALMATENNSMHKTVESLPYLKECAHKCWEFQGQEITGSGNQRCWSKDEITVAESARIESCHCDDQTNGDGTKKYPTNTKENLIQGYMCVYIHPSCEIRNLEDMDLVEDLTPAEKACAEAQANLDAFDPDDFGKFDAVIGKLDVQAACEEACSELGETCGFLINGISFALLALLAFLRN